MSKDSKTACLKRLSRIEGLLTNLVDRLADKAAETTEAAFRAGLRADSMRSSRTAATIPWFGASAASSTRGRSAS